MRIHVYMFILSLQVSFDGFTGREGKPVEVFEHVPGFGLARTSTTLEVMYVTPEMGKC